MFCKFSPEANWNGYGLAHVVKKITFQKHPATGVAQTLLELFVWKCEAEYDGRLKSESVRGKVVLLSSTMEAAHKESRGKVSLVQADM